MVTIGDVAASANLAVLENASERKVPWADVASALLQLEASGVVDSSGRPWAQVGADKSQFKPDTLRRMIKVLHFVESIAADTKIKDVEILKKLNYSQVDVLMRIGSFDQNEAIRIFNTIDRNGKIPFTFRSLLSIHERVRETTQSPSPIIAVNKRFRQFKDRCNKLLRTTNVLRLDEISDLLRNDKSYKYSSPDFVVIRRSGSMVECVEGIDCHVLQGPSQKDLVIKRVLRTALEASFFDRFWVVLPPDHAEAFEKERLLLGMTNVGLIIVDDQASAILGTPQWPPAQPNPDRRHIWRTSAAI